jgi:aspartate kinase
MIVQNDPDTPGRSAEISFTVPKDDLRIARDALTALVEEVDATLVEHPEMGKVSIVGAGMRSHPGVAAKVFAVLGEQGINIDMISTSPIKISCVIDRDRVVDAVRCLHDAFELSGPGTTGTEDVFAPKGAA